MSETVDDTVSNEPMPRTIDWANPSARGEGSFEEGLEALLGSREDKAETASPVQQSLFGTTKGAESIKPSETKGESADAAPAIADEQGASAQTDESADAAPAIADDEPTTLPEEFLGRVSDMIPGAAIETGDDLVEHIGALQEAQAAVENLNQLGDLYPELIDVVHALREGETWGEVVARYQDAAEVPDPQDDPEAYADYKVRMARREEQQKARDKEEKRVRRRQERAERSARSAWDAFAQRSGMSEAEQKEFLQLYNSLFSGDPITGAFPKEAFDIVHRGLSAGSAQTEREQELTRQVEELQAQVEAAKKEGYIQGARAVRDKAKRLPEVPDLDGAGSADPNYSEAEETVIQLANSLSATSRSWLDDAKKGNW